MDATKLLMLLTTAVLMLNLAVEIGLWTAVPGTRQRWVLSTVRRAIGWNWALANGLSLLVSLREHEPAARIALSIVAFVAGLVVTWHVYNSQDDSWFSGRGRKITRGARRRLDALTSRLGPAPHTA